MTIGPVRFLARLEGPWPWPKNPLYRNLDQLWVTVFAVPFGLGLVASTIIVGFGSSDLAKLLRTGPEPLEEAIRGEDLARKPRSGPSRP